MPEVPPYSGPGGQAEPDPARSGGPEADPVPGTTPAITLTPGTTPSPSGGRTPATTPRGRVSSHRKGCGGPALERWEYWWGINKDSYLWSPRRIHSGPTVVKEFDLGKGDDANVVLDTVAPTRAALMADLLPVCDSALESGVCDTRIAAILSLGKLKHSSVLTKLLQSLRDPCPTVRASAAIAMGIHGDPMVIPILSDIVADSKSGRMIVKRSSVDLPARCYAAAGLGLTGSELALEPLLKALSLPAKFIDVSLSAAVALGALAHPEAVPVLARVVMSGSSERRLRAHALAALGRIGDRSVLGLAHKYMEDTDADIRRSAIIACGLLAEPRDVQVVQSLRTIAEQGRDPLSCNWALIALGEVGGPQSRKSLLRVLHTETSSRRVFAALGLGIQHFDGVGDPRDVQLVRRVFLDVRSASDKGGLAIALGLMNDRDAIPHLLALVESRSGPELRGHAVVALALVDAFEAEPLVRTVLREHGKPQLSWDTARSLGRLGGRTTVRALVRGVRIGSDQEMELHGAVLSLGYMGDQSAVESLCKLALNHKTSSLHRVSAIQALGFLADRAGTSSAVPRLYELKRHCNYGLQFPALNGFMSFL